MAKKIITLLFFLLGIISAIRTSVSLFGAYFLDFHTYYFASTAFVNRANPYVLFIKQGMGFLYPPFLLLLLSPLTFFNFSIASKIWLVLSLIGGALSIYLLWKICRISTFLLAIVFLGFVLSFPFKFTLGTGQVNLIVLLLLVLTLFLYQRKSKFFVLSLAVSSGIKLFPIFYYVLHLLSKEYRNVILLVICTLLIILLPFLFLHSQSVFFYFDKIVPSFIHSKHDVSYYDQSLSALLTRLGVSPVIDLGIRLGLFIISLIVIYMYRKNYYLSFSFMTVTLLLVNSFTWQHHLIFLLIPFYFYIAVMKKNIVDIILVVIAYILVSINIKDPSSFSHIVFSGLILSHATIGIILLWMLLIYQMQINSQKMYDMKVNRIG